MLSGKERKEKRKRNRVLRGEEEQEEVATSVKFPEIPLKFLRAALNPR